MKEEDPIEALAWQLAKATGRDSNVEAPDADEIERYRSSEEAAQIDRGLAEHDSAREHLLKSAQVEVAQPSDSIRERVLASKFGPDQKPMVSRFTTRWAAAVAVLGVGIALFFVQSTPVSSISTSEFSALSFQVSASGLQEFRGSPLTEAKPGQDAVLRIAVHRDTPIVIVLESSVTPTQPLHYALFQQTEAAVKEISNVEVEHYPGAAKLSVSSAHIRFSDQAVQRLYAVVSRGLDVDTKDAVASQLRLGSNAQSGDVKVYAIDVILSKP